MRWEITELGKSNADPGTELPMGIGVSELSRGHWGTGSFGVCAAEQCRTEDCRG